MRDVTLNRSLLLSGLLAAVLTAFGISSISAAPGDLDPTFGVGGRTFAEAAAAPAYAAAIATVVQPDGRIIVAGAEYGTSYSEFQDPGFVVRFMPDGTVDQSFGMAGKIRFFRGGRPAIAVQPDGKLLIGAYHQVMRFLPNGQPDTSFGVNGVRQLEPHGIISSIQVQDDGKIVLITDYEGYWPIQRLETNGTIDPSFGSGGQIMWLWAGIPFHVFPYQKLSRTLDGRIVLVGDWVGSAVTARYDMNGMPDQTFGTNGEIRFNGVHKDSLVQPDDKIVTLISEFDSPAHKMVRRNADGTFDSAFGDSGTVDISGLNLNLVSISLTREGKIVAHGHTRTGPRDLAVVRFRSDGSLDNSFGSGGVVRHPMPAASTGNLALGSGALDAEGRLIIPGHLIYANGTLGRQIVVSRVLVTDSSEITISGRVTAPNGMPLRNVAVTVIDPDGVRRTAMTSSFGVYSISGLRSGVNYQVTAYSKRYRFQAASVAPAGADVTGVDLLAAE